jgi:two-component system, OmpR family, copper resistance phosphate regulon response regulator CusR
MASNILLVEDDPKLGNTVKGELEKNGFTVKLAYDGKIAERLFSQETFDVVLLDINVPVINGFDLCKSFRIKNAGVPIIMLTALGEMDDKMEAFGAGADDYIVKPFNIKELIARINVFIKRSSLSEQFDEILEIGDLKISKLEKKAYRNNVEINLTVKELKLLDLLARNRGRVISKQEIAEKVWDISYDTGTNTIEVYINFLRNKIDKPFAGEKLIHTKPGFGYYMKKA